jgi:hypothetical protein
MKIIFLFFILAFCPALQAQQKKAMTYQQQVQSQKNVKDAPKAIPETRFRFLALFEDAFTSPKDLNDFKNQQLWAGTGVSNETFSALPGFSVSAGIKSGNGIYSLELDQHGKKLPSGSVSATMSVRDSVETQTLQIGYDHVFQSDPLESFEIGLSAGQALKFRYINNISVSNIGAPDTVTGVIWEDTPYVFRVRGAYNYYFSANVGLRLALSYTMLTSDSLKAADNYNVNYNGQPVTSGRTLTDVNGNAVKMDLSGVRAGAGISVNF